MNRKALMKGKLLASGVGMVVSGLAFVNAVAAQLSCSEWNTAAFFRDAAAADVVRCLETGAGIEARGGLFGWTPLHLAAKFSSSPDVVEALLKAGANIEARDKFGWTPLHWAAESSNSPGVVETLLKAGVDTEAQDEKGVTPPAQGGNSWRLS